MIGVGIRLHLNIPNLILTGMTKMTDAITKSDAKKMLGVSFESGKIGFYFDFLSYAPKVLKTVRAGNMIIENDEISIDKALFLINRAYNGGITGNIEWNYATELKARYNRVARKTTRKNKRY